MPLAFGGTKPTGTLREAGTRGIEHSASQDRLRRLPVRAEGQIDPHPIGRGHEPVPIFPCGAVPITAHGCSRHGRAAGGCRGTRRWAAGAGLVDGRREGRRFLDLGDGIAVNPRHAQTRWRGDENPGQTLVDNRSWYNTQPHAGRAIGELCPFFTARRCSSQLGAEAVDGALNWRARSRRRGGAFSGVPRQDAAATSLTPPRAATGGYEPLLPASITPLLRARSRTPPLRRVGVAGSTDCSTFRRRRPTSER